jgi:hypothetical protein
VTRSLVGIALAAVLIPGCAPPIIIASAGVSALQAGTEAFINGRLEAAQLAPLQTVYEASLGALRDMEINVAHEILRRNAAGVEARDLQGREIQIDLVAVSPKVTKLRIRIGVWGDQAISRLILGQIQGRCPTPEEPGPVPAKPG